MTDDATHGDFAETFGAIIDQLEHWRGKLLAQIRVRAAAELNASPG